MTRSQLPTRHDELAGSASRTDSVIRRLVQSNQVAVSPILALASNCENQPYQMAQSGALEAGGATGVSSPPCVPRGCRGSFTAPSPNPSLPIALLPHPRSSVSEKDPPVRWIEQNMMLITRTIQLSSSLLQSPSRTRNPFDPILPYPRSLLLPISNRLLHNAQSSRNEQIQFPFVFRLRG